MSLRDELEDILDNICEINRVPYDRCFVRGVHDFVTEEEFLESYSEDIVETNLREIINRANEIIDRNPEIEDIGTDYYSFVRGVRKIEDAEDFIKNCPENERVCATVLYYLSKGEYNKIFEDEDIISNYVGNTDVDAEIECNEDTCVVRYYGVNADYAGSPHMSLDYPILIVFEGEHHGINLYEDGDIVKPTKLLAELLNPLKN